MHTVCTPVLLGGAEPDEDTLKQTFESSPQPAGAGNDEDGKPLDSARQRVPQSIKICKRLNGMHLWSSRQDKLEGVVWFCEHF